MHLIFKDYVTPESIKSRGQAEKSMATLKEKMQLYSSAAPTNSNLENSSSATLSGSQKKAIAKARQKESPKTRSDYLQFGSYRFTLISDGFYIYTNQYTDLQFGKKKLSGFLPWQFSDMLELSNTISNDAINPDEVLFLDTETTGLNRSGATIAFLIGTARFIQNKLVTELLFIQNPVGESAALDYLTNLQKKYRYLVSYNGKSFDVPLIRNRMILNRKKGLKIGYHFDLLHIFRKLFVKGTVRSWAQQEMEKFVFDYHRKDDLPGAEIPQIYFDYVKYNHDAGLARVFEHNEMDVLGLAFLFLEAIRIYSNRDHCARSGLARILLKNRKDDEALELLNDLVQNSTDLTQIQYRDRMLLANLYRQRNNIQKSISIFQSLVQDFECPWAHMSLAKIFEHKFKDYHTALIHARILLKKIDQSNDYNSGMKKKLNDKNEKFFADREIKNRSFIYPSRRGIYSKEGILHRIKRIEAKQKKQDCLT